MATARELLLPNIKDEELDQLRDKWAAMDERIEARKIRRLYRRARRHAQMTSRKV